MGFLDLFRGNSSPNAQKKKDYEMERVLGSGTYGEVRLATQKSTGRKVAIKVISKSFLKAHGKTDMVEKEMFVLGLIRQPNIIELIDHFESSDKYYLVFPVATGGELFDRIVERKRFTERDAAIIMATVINAVAYLHDPPHLIIHRDLKPENLLFLTKENDSPMVLVDFGISKVLTSPEDQLKTVIGSPGYTAPEILRRVPYGREVDLYSCGVITFTLIAGYSPFYAAQDSTAMADAVVTGKWKFEAPEWTNVTPESKDFIKRLMLINPKKRMTAHEAMDHVWLTSNCPPGYIDHLKRMNEHCIAAEYKALGLEIPPEGPVAPAAAAAAPAPAHAVAPEAAQAAAVAEPAPAQPAPAEAPAAVAAAAAVPTPAAPADSPRQDTAAYNSILQTLDRYQAPTGAQNLLEIHAIAAENRRSRWHTISTKALALKEVDLLFQSVHIKHALKEAASKAAAAGRTDSFASDKAAQFSDDDDAAPESPVRIDPNDSINRKVFKLAPSPEALAAYEELMKQEAAELEHRATNETAGLLQLAGETGAAKK
ncbi:kinase-like domain-containing protein [Hyaloraphidium curvatum]|nr:kinase-like domain-containing protein [Hyaloraphidium curvatum]